MPAVSPPPGRRVPGERRRGLGLLDVVGPSMQPTLRAGDTVLVRWGGRVRTGRIVVAAWPEHPGLLVVKRAVRAVPGGWWVEGDNPAASDDSRTRGAVPRGAVHGRVLVRLPGRGARRLWQRCGQEPASPA